MGLLSGCGSDDTDAVADYDRRVARIDDAVDEVIARVLDETGGQRRGSALGVHQVCGPGPPVSSAQFQVKANDRGLAIVQALSTATEAFAGAFADDGWEVGPVTDTGFEATLDDDMTATVETGAGGLMLTVSSGCVDMSSDTAEDIADRPRTDDRF